MQMAYSVQERVYMTLRTKILNLELAPGTSMSTQELADRLEVSRTPVREAFIRLQRDGLVNIIPQRETTVSRIDMHRVGGERFMRKCLETAALLLFLEQRTAIQLQRLDQLIARQLDAARAGECEALRMYDDEFHCQIFICTGQNLSWEVLEQMNTHYQRVRLLSLRDPATALTVVAQHAELLRAMECGQAEDAVRLLDMHLQKLDTEEVVLRQEYPDYFMDTKLTW